MISKWNYLPLTQDEQKAKAILDTKYASVPPISELLVQLGFKTV